MFSQKSNLSTNHTHTHTGSGVQLLYHHPREIFHHSYSYLTFSLITDSDKVLYRNSKIHPSTTRHHGNRSTTFELEENSCTALAETSALPNNNNNNNIKKIPRAACLENLLDSLVYRTTQEKEERRATIHQQTSRMYVCVCV